MNTENLFRAFGCCALAAIITFAVLTGKRSTPIQASEMPEVATEFSDNTDV